jgi:hypothetical protein
MIVILSAMTSGNQEANGTLERRPRRNQSPVEGPLSRAVSWATGTRAERPEWIEGAFESEAVAEAVAARLRDVFPGRVVTVEEHNDLHRIKVRPKL